MTKRVVIHSQNEVVINEYAGESPWPVTSSQVGRIMPHGQWAGRAYGLGPCFVLGKEMHAPDGWVMSGAQVHALTPNAEAWRQEVEAILGLRS